MSLLCSTTIRGIRRVCPFPSSAPCAAASAIAAGGRAVPACSRLPEATLLQQFCGGGRVRASSAGAGPAFSMPVRWASSKAGRKAVRTPRKQGVQSGKGKGKGKGKAAPEATAPTDGQGHNVSQIENTYQRKTAVEHVLLRPGMYIGAVEPQEGLMWVYNKGKHRMEQKEMNWSAAICKVSAHHPNAWPP